MRSCHFIGLASRGKSVLERAPSNSLIYPASLVSFAAILIEPDVLGDISISGNMAPPERFVIDETTRHIGRKRVFPLAIIIIVLKYYLFVKKFLININRNI